MATQSQAVTAVPVNLVVTMGLTLGLSYLVQHVNHRSEVVVFLAEAPAQPDPSMAPPHHLLGYLQGKTVTVATDGIWVWCPEGSEVSVTESR